MNFLEFLNLNTFSENCKGMNSNGPPFGLRPPRTSSARRQSWPDRPMPVAGRGRSHRMAHACGTAWWRARRWHISDRGDAVGGMRTDVGWPIHRARWRDGETH
jgi:hypothetical protein